MLSGFEDCFKSWELPRLFTLRNLIPGAENCGRETDVQVTEKSTPLVLKLTEDLPDGPYKTYYNLVFNYAMLFYLAIYTISILIPRDFLGNYDLTFIGHYIPKLNFEINFSQIRYAEKLNSYLLSYFLMLSATVPVVFLMAFYGILNGRRHPFSNAQKRQFKKWHIVSPLLQYAFPFHHTVAGVVGGEAIGTFSRSAANADSQFRILFDRCSCVSSGLSRDRAVTRKTFLNL